MRPFLVLALVAIAAAALFFTYRALDGGTGTGTSAVPTGSDAAVDGSRGTAVLDTPGSGGTRNPQSVADQRDPASLPTGIGGSYSNRLVGRVTDPTGAPLPGSKVSFSSKPMSGELLGQSFFASGSRTQDEAAARRIVHTDSKGEFSFEFIEPGNDYYLMAQHEDFRLVHREFVRVGAKGDTVEPDIQLSVGSILEGYVGDTGNNPVPDATIHLDSAFVLGTDLESPDRMSTTTDASGFYQFKNLSGGHRTVSVTAAGYGTLVKHNRLFKGDPGVVETENFELDFGNIIAGTVRGPENEGVEGVRVMALNYGNNEASRGEAYSDEDGHFEITDLRNGIYMMVVEADAYRPGEMTRVQTGNTTVSINLLHRARVRGFVSDGQGNAVQNFEVSLRQVNQQNTISENTGFRQVVEDSPDGSYEIVGLDPANYRVYATAPGFAATLSETFNVTTDTRVVEGINVAMNLGGILRGRIVDSHGTPIPNAQVSSHDSGHVFDAFGSLLQDWIASDATERTTRTSSDGTFSLELMTPAQYMIRVSHPDYADAIKNELTVQEGQVTEITDLELRRGGSIRGVVYGDAGEPLANGYVRIRNDQDPNGTDDTRTDSQGRYLFEHVPANAYMIFASSISPTGGSGDAFKLIIDQRQSEQEIRVNEGGELNIELSIGG